MEERMGASGRALKRRWASSSSSFPGSWASSFSDLFLWGRAGSFHLGIWIWMLSFSLLPFSIFLFLSLRVLHGRGGAPELLFLSVNVMHGEIFSGEFVMTDMGMGMGYGILGDSMLPCMSMSMSISILFYICAEYHECFCNKTNVLGLLTSPSSFLQSRCKLISYLAHSADHFYHKTYHPKSIEERI